ncbi:unnamed protein product [Zymoseptoria tritici ST99CH_3D7]|uniref:Uncharacterized protein n=3 Tax=Zymoseptoria tritici TaxID=1047171 RepID=A0A1X7S039_ZYMT9|nr:unnamed protein product [Zymoseptoria tritici ST99CH_3D7]
MKVKVNQDDEARKIIDDYDEWYEDWNLQDMMQERMSQKEKKHGSGSGSASRRTSASTSARSTPVPSNTHRRQPRMRDSIQHVDPALNNHNRHRQPHVSRSVTPSNGYALDSFYSRGSGLAPPLHNWAPDASLFNSPIKQESLDSDYSDDDTFDPLPRRAPLRRAGHRQRDSLPSVMDDDFEQEIAANDNSKLKGIVWPGMSIFDSATAEMQRKRNQKKHGSVLIQLQATSEETEPVEFVFRDFNLEKQRTITGNPESSDSLIEGESSPEPEVPEKKRARRKAPRPALVEKDTNSGRILRNRGDSHHPPVSRKRSPYYDVVKIEDDNDDDITYGKPQPRKRAGLSIHRDNSGPDITFNNPAQMHYLTTGFPNTGRQSARHRQPLAPLDHNANALQSDGYRPRNQFRQSDVWGQLNGGFRPSAHMPNLSNSNINFASFGQLMNQGLAAPNNLSHQSHHGPLQFQQQYANYVQAQPQHMPQNENTMFTQPHQQNVAAWDNNMFGFSNTDMSLLAGSDLNFTVNATESNAPVFFKEDAEVVFKEDDEVTLSAENSEN